MAADLLGAREIVNYVSLDNTPSVRVQESLGFVLSGTEEYPGCPAGVGIFRRALTAAEVTIRERWRHFKGGEYQMLGLAGTAKPARTMWSIRRSTASGDTGCVRPPCGWKRVTRDGQTRPRFVWISGE